MILMSLDEYEEIKDEVADKATAFEKEAEIYALSNFGFRGKNSQRVLTAKIDYQQGAEFGYNKANKWHFVKDDDLPKGEGAVLIYWKFGDIKCASVVEPYKVTEDTHIIAWKEIVLPKEK